jgi:FMNH2-dependent dimethyl sulfone monooxygenase
VLKLTAALASRTKTIQIMPAVYPRHDYAAARGKNGRHPRRITGGRFAINVVNGWFQKEFELFSNGAWIESSDARNRPAVRCSGQGKQGGDP